MKTLLVATALLSSTALAFADDHRHVVEHVLIISVDGMHAQDLARCIADGTCPHKSPRWRATA